MAVEQPNYAVGQIVRIRKGVELDTGKNEDGMPYIFEKEVTAIVIGPYSEGAVPILVQGLEEDGPLFWHQPVKNPVS